MSVYFAILGGALVLAAVLAVVRGTRNGWRFGRVFGPRTVVDDAAPYRASSHRDVHARGVPTIVWVAALSAIFWGLATLAVFVPAGGLLAAMMLSSGQGTPALGGFALAAICMAGLPVALMFFIHASRLLKRDASQLEGFVRWSVGHHLVVLLYFLALGFGAEGAGGLAMALLIVGIPTAFGILQAMSMHAAHGRLTGIGREEDAGLALPPVLPTACVAWRALPSSWRDRSETATFDRTLREM